MLHLLYSKSTVIKPHFRAPKHSLQRRSYERFVFTHYGSLISTVKVEYGTIK